MRIVVTGASGFLGTHLTRALVARGDAVVPFGRDLDPAAILARPIDAVHHLAFDLEALLAGEREDRRVNVDGAARAVEAAIDAGARHVVFASSGLVYGDPDALPIDERLPLRPRTANGLSKLRTETALGELCAKRGVTLTVLRYANLYGGGPRDRSVIARFLEALAENRAVQIAGDGSQTRDFIHVDEVVAANLGAADLALAGPWNVGTGIETSILEAWELVQEVCGRRGTIEWIPARGEDRARNALDGSRLRERLGLPDPRGVGEGVRGIVRGPLTTDY